MTPAASPALSVILIAPAEFVYIQKTVRHLAAQTRARELELVVVTSAAERLQAAPGTWANFHSVRVVESDLLDSTGAPRVRGFYASSAPLVAFAEDHAFPSPNWADVLIRAHAKPYAAVSIEMKNENPGSLSNADMQLSFGQWIAPAVRGVMSSLPGHNTCYKREILNSYRERLEAMLNSEAVLHQDLTRDHHQLFLETQAYITHLNVSQWLAFFKHKLWGGRIFGGTRAQEGHWSFSKRMAYALGAPLIPFVRLYRMVPNLRRTGALESFDALFLTALSAGLVTHALGECIGYALGFGDARRKYTQAEFHRVELMRREEHRLAFE